MQKIVFNRSIFSRLPIKSFYGMADAAISPVLMLIATPIFLTYLGVEGYAIWVLINSIIASLSLFNFGANDVLIKYISLGLIDENKKVLSTIFFIQTFVVLFIYFCFLVGVYFFSESITKNSVQIVSILYIALPIFFIKQFEQSLYAFYKGHEMFGHVALFSTVSKFLFFSAQVLLAITTRSIYDVFLAGLVISIILLVVQMIYMKKTHKDAVFFQSASIKKAKSMIFFGGWNWLSSIASILNSHSDKWIIVALLGLETFGFYSLGILILNQLHNIAASSVAWIFPEISNRKNNGQLLSERYWRLMLAVIVGSYIVSLLLMQSSFLFEWWLNTETYASAKLYIDIFLIIFPVFTLSIVSYFYLLGLGLVKEKFYSDVLVLASKVLILYFVIMNFEIDKWPLVFLIFISIQFISYSRIICKNIPIKIEYLYSLLLLQLSVAFFRAF